MDRIEDLHIARWQELPCFDLYVDQIVDFITKNLSCLYEENEKIVTRTMINGYVKQGLISPPIKKKYSRDQLAYLMVICLLKNVYSLEEVKKLLHIQIDAFPLSRSYDYFLIEFEDCLKHILRQDDTKRTPATYDNQEVVFLLHSTVLSLVYKIKIQKSLKNDAR